MNVDGGSGDMFTRGRAEGEQASRVSTNADGGSGDMNCCRIRQTHARHLHLFALALLLSGHSFVLFALIPSLCHTCTSLQRFDTRTHIHMTRTFGLRLSFYCESNDGKHVVLRMRMGP